MSQNRMIPMIPIRLHCGKSVVCKSCKCLCHLFILFFPASQLTEGKTQQRKLIHNQKFTVNDLCICGILIHLPLFHFFLFQTKIHHFFLIFCVRIIFNSNIMHTLWKKEGDIDSSYDDPFASIGIEYRNDMQQ